MYQKLFGDHVWSHRTSLQHSPRLRSWIYGLDPGEGRGKEKIRERGGGERRKKEERRGRVEENWRGSFASTVVLSWCLWMGGGKISQEKTEIELVIHCVVSDCTLTDMVSNVDVKKLCRK